VRVETRGLPRGKTSYTAGPYILPVIAAGKTIAVIATQAAVHSRTRFGTSSVNRRKKNQINNAATSLA